MTSTAKHMIRRVYNFNRPGRIFLILALLIVFWPVTSYAQTFRFTASADNRPDDPANLARWEWLLDEMTTKVGDEGVFHIMPGDFDSPDITDATLKTQFGSGVVWYPVVGNHEAETAADMTWIRDAYSSLPYIVNVGPSGCETTTYSFDYGNAHFVAINEYYNGTSDTGTNGDVVDALYNWLVADLAANTKPAVFVIGHEPAYPLGAHVNDSLDGHPANRDRFWKLLNDNRVIAYLCGHTHYYSAIQQSQTGDYPCEAFTWQIDCGNAGNPREPEQTFIDIVVSDADVTFNTWQGLIDKAYIVTESWTVEIPGTDPEADLLVPLDNGADDLDPSRDAVTVNTTQPNFQIQLTDFDGIDDTTVTPATVSITGLTQGMDYDFAYNASTDVITLTSLGADFGNGTYDIILSDGGAQIADVLGNPMPATLLVVLIDTSILPPETLIFQQQDVGGYTGAVDTMIRYGDSGTVYATAAELNSDASSSGSSGTGPSHVLIQFTGIIGEAADQIPAGSAITAATLRLRANDSSNGGKAHRLLQTWTDGVTWNSSFGLDGVDADDLEAAGSYDDGVSSTSAGMNVDLDVTASVQAWVDGTADNYGWAILPGGTDGWHMVSSEGTQSYRPILTVEFIAGGNRKPVADAGDDQTVKDLEGDGETITLDGSSSYDPDGDIVLYEWTVDSTPITDISEPFGDGITPVTLDIGTHTAMLKVTDNEGSTSVDQVTIAVTENHAPAAVNDAYEAVRDTSLIVNAANGVLANDTDSDGDSLTAALVSGPSATAMLALNPDGSFAYTPGPGFTGTDSFTYIASDGTLGSSEATVTIDVKVPVLFSDDFESGGFAAGGWQASAQASVESTAACTGNYGVLLKKSASIETTINTGGATTATLTFWAGASGLNNEYLSVEWFDSVSGWQLLLELTGTQDWAVFSYDLTSITDSQFGLRFLINGNAGNDLARIDDIVITAGPGANTPPIAVDDEYSVDEDTTLDVAVGYGVSSNDSDGDGDSLTASVLDPPANGILTLNGDGSFTYNPDLNYAGIDSFTYTISDGNGGTDTATVVITVDGVNDAPSITSTAVTSATVGALYSYDVDATDPDAGANLTYSLSAAPTGMTIDGGTGLISWTPTSDQVGVTSVTVSVSDGTLSDSQEFDVNVSGANNPPTIVSTPITTATEDTPYSYDVDATDPDGDTLTYSLAVAPAGMNIDPATGEITWTPTNAQVGDNLVTVVVEDSAAASDSQSFTVAVANVNDAPQITSTPVTSATVDTLYTYDVDASDPDAGDSLTLTFSLIAAPAGMTIDADTGLIQWTPTVAGDYDATVQVADSSGATGTQAFTITVAGSQPALHVASITMELIPAGRNWKGEATVLVLDAGGTPVTNATVIGNWKINDVSLETGASAVTDSSGTAAIVSVPEKAKTDDVYTFTVTDIICTGYVYDSGANVETEDSISVP